MRKIFINIALLLAIASYSQTVPQAFNYQGIARDVQGTSLGSKTLGIKITLQEKIGNTTTDVYAETHSVTTNAYGLFNISIGRGIATIGTFGGVNFSGKNISVRTEIDPNGGSNYSIVGNSELLSVPYALVAGNTASNNNSYWEKNTTTNALFVNTNEKVGIGTSAPEGLLHLSQNASGAERNMVMVNNTNNGPDATVGLTLKVGTASDDILALGYNGPNYNVLPNVQSRATILSKNIDLKAQSSAGSIKFYTGGQIGGTSGTERMSINPDGNIGIGTSLPTAVLDLIGSARFRSLAANTTNTRLLTADASGNLAFRDLSSISSLNGPWTKDNITNSVTVSNGEKVGIGIANPTQPLHIESNQTGAGRQFVRIKNTNPNNDGAAMVDIHAGNTGFSLIQHSPNYNQVPGYSGMSTFMTAGSGIILNTITPSAFISLMTGGSGFENEKMRVTADGKVGIGTQTPTTTLDVAGTTRFRSLTASTTNTRLLTADASGNLAFRDLSSISSLNGPWTNVPSGISYTQGGVVISDASQQKVGLTISRNATAADRMLAVMENTSNTDNSSAVSLVQAGTGANNVSVMFAAFAKSYFPDLINSGCGTVVSQRLSLTSQPVSNNSDGYIKFVTGGNSSTEPNSGQERMRITYDGNIGIGTSAPKAKLQVAQGDIYLDDATKGVIMTSPNGQCWRMTVSNTGAFVSTAITCP